MLGVLIVLKANKILENGVQVKNIAPLAVFGGFMDSVKGGGWGSIVSSTLIAQGNSPRLTIGSVNLAEFFAAFSSSLTFFMVIGFEYW